MGHVSVSNIFKDEHPQLWRAQLPLVNGALQPNSPMSVLEYGPGIVINNIPAREAMKSLPPSA
jgi:hypothetical protein